MAEHLLRLICCPTIGVGGGVDQAGTRRGLFGSINGSTGSSRGRGRGPRLWRLRAGSAERPRRGGGGRTVSRNQCSRPSSGRHSLNIVSIKQKARKRTSLTSST